MTQPTSAKRVLKPSPAIRGQALIDDWRRSGLSRSAYARQHQVGAHLLTYWSKRLLGPMPAPAGTAVSVAKTAIIDFVQVPSAGHRSAAAPPAAPTSSLEIRLSCGALIRVAPGVDPALLRLVVRTLEESPC